MLQQQFYFIGYFGIEAITGKGILIVLILCTALEHIFSITFAIILWFANPQTCWYASNSSTPSVKTRLISKKFWDTKLSGIVFTH